MITVEQFYDRELWVKFSKTCKFRVLGGYHWPEGNPDDACTYVDERTGGGVYASCCFTVCMAWLDQLSEFGRTDVLAEMNVKAGLDLSFWCLG